MGRATQGVKVIELAKRNDTISSVCHVEAEPEEEEIPADGEETPVEGETPANDAETPAAEGEATETPTEE